MASREKRASFKVGDEGGDIGTLRRDITIGWEDIFFLFEEIVKVLQYFCEQGERGKQKKRVAGDK